MKTKRASPSSDSSDSEVYEVESVVGRKVADGGLQYLLKWKGYEEKTWTPIAECGSCKKLIEAFEKEHPSPSRNAGRPPGGSQSSQSSKRESKRVSKATVDSDDDSASEDEDKAGSSSTPAGGRASRSQRSSKAGKHSASPAGGRTSPKRAAKSRGSIRSEAMTKALKETSSEEDEPISSKPATSRKSRSANSSGKGDKSKKVPVYSLLDSESDEEEEKKKTPVKAAAPKRGASSTGKADSQRKKKKASESSDSDEEEKKRTPTRGAPPKRMSILGRQSSSRKKEKSPSSSSSSEDEGEDGGFPLLLPMQAKKGTRRPSDVVAPASSTSSTSESSNSDDARGKGKGKQPEKRHSPIKRPIINVSDLESTDSEVEKEKTRTPRQTARRTGAPASTASITRASSSNAKTASARSPSGSSRRSLVSVLTELLASDPVVTPVSLSPKGSKKTVKSREEEKKADAPVKVLKPEEVPGIMVWTRESYEEEYSIPKTLAAGAVEKFADREVERIVGFVTHAVHPFVLVQLGMKKGESSLAVTDAVQGVHAHLASLLMPKSFADYSCRMALMSASQASGGASGADADDSGPSTSNGRGAKRAKK